MSEYDERWDEAEAEVDRGSPWKPKEPGSLNPLTIQVDEWVSVTSDYGETDLMVGRDREGKRWSVLAGSTILRKLLIDGIVEEWDDEGKKFVIKETLGKVQVGEIVSLKYEGEREGGKFTYSNYNISRKPARDNPSPPPPPRDSEEGSPSAAVETSPTPTVPEDAIPFSAASTASDLEMLAMLAKQLDAKDPLTTRTGDQLPWWSALQVVARRDYNTDLVSLDAQQIGMMYQKALSRLPKEDVASDDDDGVPI